MTSEEIAELFSRTNEYRSIKYDLRNMQALMDRLGNPQNSFKCALIAGTNGKGSVAALLSAMMPDAGLYTSPHLSRLNERIRIGDRQIPDADLKRVYDLVNHTAPGAHAAAGAHAATAGGGDLLYPPTYFEMVTAMAFCYFRDRVRFAVLEVGLGGRLDATNVVQQDVSIITSIGLDHQEFLGATLDEIAAEKAGIIKDREPVVIGPEADREPVRARAGDRLLPTASTERSQRALGRGYFEFDVETPVRRYSGLKPQLAGRHQLDNVVVAIRAAECLSLPAERIETGINTAVWPGRLERIPGNPSILLDGAHNPAAARALASFLGEFYPEGVCMIFGCMADKNYQEMLTTLRPHARKIIFTKAQNSRSEDPVRLQALAPGSHVESSLRESAAYARSHCSASETVLICGSLYLVGEARELSAIS